MRNDAVVAVAPLDAQGVAPDLLELLHVRALGHARSVDDRRHGLKSAG